MERNELERRLREIREPAPPSELRARLEQGIPDSTRQPETGWGPRRIPMFAKLAATAAMLGGVVWVSVMMLVGPASQDESSKLTSVQSVPRASSLMVGT